MLGLLFTFTTSLLFWVPFIVVLILAAMALARRP